MSVRPNCSNRLTATSISSSGRIAASATPATPGHNWLGELYKLLNRFDDRKLIATGLHGELMRRYRNWRIASDPDYQIWSRTGCGCLLIRRSDWEVLDHWSETAPKIGAEFCVHAHDKGYYFIVPIPAVAFHMDNAPSYNKNYLRKSVVNTGKQVWRMRT